MYNFLSIIQTAANIATTLGILVAILLYFRDKIKNKEEKFFLAYDSIDDKYVDFLKICIEHPELGCHLQSKENIKLTEKQRIQQLAVFEILISIFERAFILYKIQPKRIKIHQWDGWSDYIENWFQKENFRKAWEAEGTTWDLEFMKFMNSIYIKEIIPKGLISEK